jgi:hypothetical protein
MWLILISLGVLGTGCSIDQNPTENDKCTNNSCNNYVDTDNDGLNDDEDNCPFVANPDQTDNDDDGSGNVCDCAPDNPNLWDDKTAYPDMDNDDRPEPGDTITVCTGDTTPEPHNWTWVTPPPYDACPNNPTPTCGTTDSDGDGVPDATDCAPNDATKWVNTTVYPDGDNDTVPNANSPQTMCLGTTTPAGYTRTVPPPLDNCPNIANTNQADTDHDGIGDACDSGTDNDHDGYQPPTDCNDSNAAVHPGATEICDGIDNNCDGQVDEGVKNTYYRDQDGDSYGNINMTTQACTVPAGYVTNSTDCNDGNAAIHPLATEICNGIDDNCNSQVDEGLTLNTYYRDLDADSYGNPAVTLHACSLPTGYVTNNTDCDDSSTTVYPGAIEICDNVDNDCDTQVDEGVKSTFYRDQDGDTYGNTANSMQACTVPSGYVANSTDCNDGNATIHPNASEICNGVDDNCNGQIDEGASLITYYRDQDGDSYGNPANSMQSCTVPAGYVTNNTDCNDGNANQWVNVSVYVDPDNDTIPNNLTAQTMCLGNSTPAGYTRTATPLDNCPTVANTNQADTDLDGIGDACETVPMDVLTVRCTYNFPRDYYQYNSSSCVITQAGSTADWQNTGATICGLSKPCVFEGELRDLIYSDETANGHIPGTCEMMPNVPSGGGDGSGFTNPVPSFRSSRGWPEDWAMIGWQEGNTQYFENFMTPNSLNCQLYRNGAFIGNVPTSYILHTWGANFLLDFGGLYNGPNTVNVFISTYIDSDGDSYPNYCPANVPGCVPDNCIRYDNPTQADSNGDHIGDACVNQPNPTENDSDNDWFLNFEDLYPNDRSRF